MGNCNCKHPRTEPYIEVEDIQSQTKPIKNKLIEDNSKLIRVKSIRYQGENNPLKISQIIENHDKSQFQINVMDSKKEITDCNSKKIMDSIILEYDINEEEQKKLREALYKHFLFKDMNDEILYIFIIVED
jgi:hypothetical protein